jgi:hypothetical protein
MAAKEQSAKSRCVSQASGQPVPARTSAKQFARPQRPICPNALSPFLEYTIVRWKRCGAVHSAICSARSRPVLRRQPEEIFFQFHNLAPLFTVPPATYPIPASFPPPARASFQTGKQFMEYDRIATNLAVTHFTNPNGATTYPPNWLCSFVFTFSPSTVLNRQPESATSNLRN